MHWFFIWIMLLPLYLNGQSDLKIKINDKRGCNCGEIDTTIAKIGQAIQIVNLGEVRDTLAACYFHCIGVQYHKKKNYLQVIQFNKKALTLREQFHKEFVWKSHYTLGIAYNELTMYAKSQSALQTAYNTWGIKYQKDTLEMFRVMANNLSEMGELQQAENYAIQATQIKIDELWRTADAFNSLSDILGREEQSDDNKRRAIECADAAIQLYKKAEEDEYYIGQALNSKANAMSWLERYNEAINTYDIALNIYNKNSEEYARTLSNKGGSLGERGDYKAAIEALFKSLEIKKNALKKAHTYTYAANHENLAENYEALGDVDKALQHYQLALQNLTNNFRSDNIHQNPIPSDSLYIYNKIDVIRVLHLKASAAVKKYQQEGDTTYLKLAEKTYNTAFNFHDQLPQQITTQESRLFHAKTIVPFIENALAVAYELQQTPKTAYRFMEKNKATVLMQAINEKGALQYAGLPDSLLQQEKELRETITAYEKQLNDARQDQKGGAIKQYENLLFEQKNTYDQLVRNLEQNHLEYYNLKYKQSTCTLKDVQNYLDSETALLEYFVGDSSVYVLAVEKNTAHLHRLDKPENWNKTISDFHKSISDANTQLSFAPHAHQLYKWLLPAPFNEQNPKIKRLQIIPDAQLNYIPFGLLLTEDDSQKTNYDLSYLLKQKSISYAYSAALLFEEKKEKNTTKYLYGGFAPKYGGVQHVDLPAGRENVKQQAAKFKCKPFLANQATKQQFTDDADQFQILQLSMHGILDDEKPLYSKLIFADSALYAADLYNTRLNADLAILSACNTGTGEIKKGEGVMSLSRAFTYAGCPSLLMSLWSVPDGGTAELVDAFLEQLQQGKTKDKALQTAQLKYLNNTSPDRLHPMYWAGLVPSGDMQAVKFSHNSPWWWGIILILGIIIYFGWRAIR